MTEKVKATRMDVYVKGKKVFSYVREVGTFVRDDVKVVVANSTNFAGD